MAKIKISYSINGKIKEIDAIKSNNTLKFIDEGVITKLIILNDNIILYRENDEYKIELNLKDKIGCCYLKNHGSIALDLKKVKFKKDDKIEIEYEIDEKVKIEIRSVV